MGLNNIFFLIQFVVLLAIIGCLQVIRIKSKKSAVGRLQLLILLLFSYYFIIAVEWKFGFCIALVTLISYGCGLIMQSVKTPAKRLKVACWGGTVLVLILAYFKYTNFFIDSINKAFGLEIEALKIILPLGISFFIFSALSYVIDVYKGICEAERNILDFGLYMAFFPKLTAGPIVRWTEFKPYVRQYRGVTLTAVNDGIQIYAFGLFKKMVLADHLGVFVDDVFFAPNAYGTATVWWAAISYSLQIYLDFSGYSDMAIGIAKILGFDFKPNFNLPYIASGFSDFWSRWHISLSQWFRDYLYIPLGGSRKGMARTYGNLLVVMLVSGLWHGAGWTFIIWGALHGIASCVSRILSAKREKRVNNGVVRLFEIMITFLFTALFWVIFRAESLWKAILYLKAMFTPHMGINQPYTWTLFAILCLSVATILAMIHSRNKGMNQINGFYLVMDLSKLWPMVVFFTICGLIILLGYFGNTAFIYGRF